jgi:hypothetical protein
MISGRSVHLSLGSRFWVLAASLFITMGCKNDEVPVIEEATPKVAPTAAPSVAARPIPAIRESQVQAVLDKWLIAQKTGDFAAYSALYAERFQGIKRVGSRTHRFDRKGWLKDRGSMFERPMKVEISDITMQTTCCLASVRFVQHWSSATFQDQGTKELLMVPSHTGLQITSEEMLFSNVARSGKAADLDAKDLRLVVHAKHSYVVLGTADRDAVGRGPIVRDDDGKQAVVTTRQLFGADSLPPDIKVSKGMAMRLYGTAGAVCSAKLGEMFLLHRVTPHFGTVQAWNGGGYPGDPNPAPPMPKREVAQAAWDEGADGALYAAEIKQTEGDCGAALWAREVDRPEPDVFHPEPPSAELETRLEAALRAVAAYKKIASNFAKDEPSKAGPWERVDGGKPLYMVWKNGGRTLASILAKVGTGCGDFSADLWLLYEVRGAQLRLLNSPDGKDEPSLFSLAAVVDANADGVPEILGGEWQNTRGEANALLRSAGKGYEIIRSNYPPFHDCGC